MRQALRIAMLAHSTNPRGGVVHAMQLSEALAEVGHEVILHAPDAWGDGFYRAPRCETRAFRVAPAPADVYAMVERRIADYFAHFSRPENRGFDVYHAHDGISGNALAMLKERGQIAGFVRTVHHLDDFADARLGRLQARAIRSADSLMVVSVLWRKRLLDDFGREASVCGNGVDARCFSPRSDGCELDLKKRLGLGPGPILLCVGGVEARKNTVRILEAFGQLLAVRPDAELVIAGGASLLDHGAYQAQFNARLENMGEAAASVRRLAVIAQADMPRLYRLASALVFASVKEGFGLCVLEAMASGIPAIVSSIEPFVGYLDAKEAIWCDPASTRSIADAMAIALCDECAAPLRKLGPEVAARFDWRSVAAACEPVYQRLLEPAHA